MTTPSLCLCARQAPSVLPPLPLTSKTCGQLTCGRLWTCAGGVGEVEGQQGHGWAAGARVGGMIIVFYVPWWTAGSLLGQWLHGCVCCCAFAPMVSLCVSVKHAPRALELPYHGQGVRGGCRPGIMPATDRIEGLSMGGRVLCQLALAVAALAGKEAAGRLTVILHVNDDQEEEVCQELHKHQFYG